MEDVALSDALRCASRLVGAAFDLEPATFMGRRKGPPGHVHARQVLMYLMIAEGRYEQKATAEAIGRHHSTACHAVQRIERLREEDGELDRGLANMTRMFREILDARARLPVALLVDIAAE